MAAPPIIVQQGRGYLRNSYRADEIKAVICNSVTASSDAVIRYTTQEN